MWSRSVSRMLPLWCSIFITGYAVAQGPITTTVKVKLDRPTLVGSNTLAPGDYTVRQVTSANNARVLEFTTNRGTKLAATVTAIPYLQNTPPSQTKVIYDNEGAQPRIARILVQGKDYGYEFPKEFVPARPAVAASMQFRYESPNDVVAAATPAPAPVAQAAPAEPAAAPAPEPQVVAQNQPAPAPVKQVEPPAAPPDPAPNAERQAPTVPATALGWADLLMAGLACTAIGLLLLRRTA
jgi:hypothetical protein